MSQDREVSTLCIAGSIVSVTIEIVLLADQSDLIQKAVTAEDGTRIGYVRAAGYLVALSLVLRIVLIILAMSLRKSIIKYGLPLAWLQTVAYYFAMAEVLSVQ